jgi:hypothetical protein
VTGCVIPRDNFETSFLQVISRRLKFVYASNPPDGPATTPSVFFTILLLLPREDSAWQIAFHRFAEVSIGIGVALDLTFLWSETEDPRTAK